MDIFLHVLLISVCGDSLNSCFMYKCFFSHILPLHKQIFSFRQEKPARHNKIRACSSRLCQQQTEEFTKIAVWCVRIYSFHSSREGTGVERARCSPPRQPPGCSPWIALEKTNHNKHANSTKCLTIPNFKHKDPFSHLSKKLSARTQTCDT